MNLKSKFIRTISEPVFKLDLLLVANILDVAYWLQKVCRQHPQIVSNITIAIFEAFPVICQIEISFEDKPLSFGLIVING